MCIVVMQALTGIDHGHRADDELRDWTLLSGQAQDCVMDDSRAWQHDDVNLTRATGYRHDRPGEGDVNGYPARPV